MPTMSKTSARPPSPAATPACSSVLRPFITSCAAAPGFSSFHFSAAASSHTVAFVGAGVGDSLVGAEDGRPVGTPVGILEGIIVGASLGAAVGSIVGASVGRTVHDVHSGGFAHARPLAQPHCFVVHSALAQKQMPCNASHKSSSVEEHPNAKVGSMVGSNVGASEGATLGFIDGASVGSGEGALDGACDGALVQVPHAALLQP